MFGVSTPTFVTPDTRVNAQLQKWSVKNAQISHFVNFSQPHVLDMIMQSLWIKTQSSPFEAPYFSCVPYLMGEGRAMQYSVWPKRRRERRFRGCLSVRRMTICAMPWSRRSLKATSNSTFACNCKPILPNADREQRRALAGATVATRLGRNAASTEAEVRLTGANGIRQEALLQSVAYHRGASAAG